MKTTTMHMMANLEPLAESRAGQVRSRKETVYAYLKELILTSSLKPGEPITEESVMSSLGVSRSPVREALNMLEREGLVVLKHNRGAEVAEISFDQAMDVMEARRFLEPIGIRLVIGRIPRNIMEEFMKRFEELLAADNVVADEERMADLEFHMAIIKHIPNRYLRETLIRIHEHSQLVRNAIHPDPQLSRQFLEGHVRIIRAVLAGDVEEAESAMSENVRAGAARLGKNHLFL